MALYYNKARNGKHMRDNTIVNYNIDVNNLNSDKTNSEKAIEIVNNIIKTNNNNVRIIINDENIAHIVFDLINGKKVVMTNLALDYDYKVGDIINFDESMNVNIYKKYQSNFNIIIAYNNGFSNIDLV